MVIAISGIALAGVGIIWHQEAQRENEKELLFIGEEYRKALVSYYEDSPNGVKQYPKELESLISDKRFQTPKHHLRKLYLDPMTHGQPWGTVKQEDRIVGIYSSSSKKPIKKSKFSSPYEGFSEANSYQNWQFIASPQ
jgi:type II secretory pathway pseudopilin PulG